jgi:hypothetical protein
VQVESPNVFELQLTRIRAELDRQGSLGEKNALECGTYYKFTEKLCVRMDSLSKEIESLKNKDDGALDMIRADLKKLETKMAQMILTSGISKPGTLLHLHMYMLYIMVTTCFVSSSTSRPRPRPGTTN